MNRKFAYAMLFVCMIASGTYVFVYLYRWEWNRALIAGLFFLIAQVAFIGANVIERLRRIERRLDKTARAPSQVDVLTAIKETAPEPRQNFSWLTKNGGDLNVFIPVLLGAGVLMSGVAWLVERLARATAQPAMERGLAVRMSPLALPEGGFLARGPQTTVSVRRYKVHRMILVVVLAAAGYMGIDALADLTQARPDQNFVGDVSRITMHVMVKDSDLPTATAATEAIWMTCRSTINKNIDEPTLAARGSQVEVLVSPALGEHASKRLVGCLEDTTIDHLTVDVLQFQTLNVAE